MLAVLALCTMSISAYAANLNDVSQGEVSADLLTQLNEKNPIKTIPNGVIGYLKDTGGSIVFKQEIPNAESYNMTAVYGLYHADGTTKNLIEIALNAPSNDQIAYNIAHEIGHFIWFNSNIYETDKETIDAMYERFKQGDVSGNMTVEEVFAEQYMSYKSNYGYYLLDAERDMFKKAENLIKDKYYAAHLEADRAADDAIEMAAYNDMFANMPDWMLYNKFGPDVYDLFPDRAPER